MSEWFDIREKPIGYFRKFVHERIDKANPRRELTAEETKRLNRLEAIADKLKRGENCKTVSCKLGLAETSTHR